MVVFGVYSSTTGAPLTGQSFSFATYRQLDGTNRTPPTIMELGGGLYRFEPSGADMALGVAYEIDLGATASPPRISGSEGGMLQAFGLYNYDGTPATGKTPVFVTYASAEGARTAPPILEIGNGLYGFNPTPQDLEAQTGYEIDAGPGVFPTRLSGHVGVVAAGTADVVPPTFTNFIPDVSTVSVASNAVIGFDVIDVSNQIRRVVVSVRFEGTDLDEMIHNGTEFSPKYTQSTRSVLANGFRYRIARTGGWPGRANFFLNAIDITGNENL